MRQEENYFHAPSLPGKFGLRPTGARRVDQSGSSHPGHYLPAPFIGGATTTENENEFLFQTKNPLSAPLVVTAPGS